MICIQGRRVVELTDAGEIFPDKPTVILVTDYPARNKLTAAPRSRRFHAQPLIFLLKSENNT